ncbi:hypothetical protein JD844_000987 [Phrynosoma platyrhinos]|uniref:CKLF like MARVEL transmembrane domain containing 5 n=1 Tax=Phrynosoma platyrhinos TaxID=52577 RepID=A0ABQ7T8W8_PHRPL|nr:hypothetical protein JD844_000987 [Phrynosoma platyrhinos]
MGEQEDPSGGLQGFALDKEFLRSPKGVLMEAELGLCFLVFLLLTASISAYMGAALLEVLVTLAFLALRATHYYERLTRVNWPCLVFSLILIAVFCFDAYKTYKAEMGSDQGEQSQSGAGVAAGPRSWLREHRRMALLGERYAHKDVAAATQNKVFPISQPQLTCLRPDDDDDDDDDDPASCLEFLL